jgi:hypothetical protein
MPTEHATLPAYGIFSKFLLWKKHLLKTEDCEIARDRQQKQEMNYPDTSSGVSKAR